MKILEALRAGRLWGDASKADKQRLLSAGGPQTGMTWTALPDPGQPAIPDTHWRIATSDRLGLLRVRAGTPCGLPRAARRGGQCGKALDSKLHHIWHGRTGVARLRIHNAIAGTLGKELRSTGGHVDLERAMPALVQRTERGEIEEAIMDVTCWWPGGLEWFGVDVTVRYAGATRYHGADRRAGAAARRGEKEKHARHGKDVLPLALEAGGRLGAGSECTLRRLADAALSTCNGFSTRRGLVARWRRRIEAALLFLERRCSTLCTRPQYAGSRDSCHVVPCSDACPFGGH